MTLLKSGAVDRMHIRKENEADALALIDIIAAEMHSRLSLHRLMPPAASDISAHGPEGRSRSCHSIAEATACADCDYIFLSPVFDSISKPGYKAVPFEPSQVKALPVKTIALGGVTPERFDQVRANGFDGAAMLGYLWQDVATQTIIDTIKCYNS